MADGERRAALRGVQILFEAGAIGGLADGALLRRFASRRDGEGEAAFALLVERHGPMVLRVCRTILADPHAAEDAFQATFLVLAQKAGALSARETIGPWLYQVAVRVASLPGLLSTTTMFGVREELPDKPHPGTVGLVLAEGTVVGEYAVPPGHFADRQPPALLMLHPPSETTPSLPECTGAASGCVLLPGIPHLGLEHRAAWVEAESDGTITGMVSRVGVDPISHPDTAILAMLLAA